MTVLYPNYVERLLLRLEEDGNDAYIVGGSLRDMLIGTEPHDYDIATSAPPRRTVELFSDMRVIETGIKHGTVTVISDGRPIEITTLRIDGAYSDSRHPDSIIFTDDVTKDLSRRDLTVNAMAYSRSRGLIDPFGGKRDVERKLLRAVREPTLRFSEDALRIMRTFRFCAQLGFDIEEATLNAAFSEKARLAEIARERISNELLRLLLSPSPAHALNLMAKGDIFEYVLDGYKPSEVITSSIEALPPSDIERLALLLSDTDRETASVILHGLRLSNKQISGTLATLTGAKLCISSEADARRLIAQTGIYALPAARISELLGISCAGAAQLVEKQQSTPCSLRELKINGKDLCRLGITGKNIGKTLDVLLTRVIGSPELNDRQVLTELAKQLNGLS